MSSRDSKASDEIKHSDSFQSLESVKPPALDAHYDPVFVKKTMSVLTSSIEPRIVAHISAYCNRRMIDWRMLPLLGLLYSVALIDRINLGIARTAGMQEDLVCPKGYTKVARLLMYFSRSASTSGSGIASPP